MARSMFFLEATLEFFVCGNSKYDLMSLSLVYSLASRL